MEIGPVNPLQICTEPRKALRFQVGRNVVADVVFTGEATAESIAMLIELLEVQKKAFPASLQEIIFEEMNTNE